METVNKGIIAVIRTVKRKPSCLIMTIKRVNME